MSENEMKMPKIKLVNIVKHFCTITRHRLLVCKHCFKIGLYWQGLTHDLSKYSPEEFWTGVRYYQGDRSPNAAEREAIGFSKAWLHHKGRNKHHFEYWIDVSLNKEEGLVGNKMPVNYVAEMLCDRIEGLRGIQREKLHQRSTYGILRIYKEIHYHSPGDQGAFGKAPYDFKGWRKRALMLISVSC